MPTARKEAAIGALTEKLAAAKNLFFTDYAGLTVDEITKLRGELRKDGNTYAVVKNTLFRIAAGDLAAQLEDVLAGPTGIVFAGVDPVAPAKALKTFNDTVKKLPSRPRTSTASSSMRGQVDMLAKLPPKIDLLAKLVGTLANPLRGLRHRALGQLQRTRPRAQRHPRTKRQPQHPTLR